jgi:hypothetical protein
MTEANDGQPSSESPKTVPAGERHRSKGLLAGGAKLVDRIWRQADFRMNRSSGGLLQKLLGVDGYSPLTAILLFVLLFLIVNGPTLRWPVHGQVLIAIAVAVGIPLIVCRFFARQGRLLVFEAVWICVVCAATWFLAGADAREWQRTLYRHQLIPLMAGLALFMAILPVWLSNRLIDGYVARYSGRPRRTLWWPDLVNKVELFTKPKSTQIGFWQFIRSLITTPLHHLVILLWPASVCVLLVPKDWMWFAAILVLAGSAAVLGFSGVHVRLNQMLTLTRRILSIGVPLVFSLIVIALAICRLADFSYLEIILNSAGSLIILTYLVAAYAIAWFYEIWISHTLCERLLALFSAADKPRVRRIPYRYRRELKDDPKPGDITTLNEGQYLQIHGGRFAAVGKYRGQDDRTPDCWQSYHKVPLFETVIYKSDLPQSPGVAANGPTTNEAKPAPEDIEELYGLADLRNRVRFYYVFLDIVAFAMIGGAAYGLYRAAPEIAETHARDMAALRGEDPGEPDGPASPNSRNLQQLIFAETAGEGGSTQSGKRRKVILIAASGGGTRAALYAASVLRGLWELEALDDVVLFSGVSGGSTSLAYLAAHYQNLVDPKGHAAWDEYMEVMAAPFIDDALRAACEARIAWSTRTGTLLAESFERRIGQGREPPYSLGDSSRALIFNTTLAASSHLTQNGWSEPNPQPAGSRLILTNLASADAFPRQGHAGALAEYLTYVVVRDPKVSVTKAAALSANFPPVFSNAGVEIGNAERHWVTDGGAADNRGIISLLYALRAALEAEKAKPLRPQGDAGNDRVPEIHIIVAEASATSRDFTQDRGIGSKFEAAEKFASQLMVELLDDVDRLYENIAGPQRRVDLHYLAMPYVFRSRGGIGTHWRLPAVVTLRNPWVSKADAEAFTFTGETVKRMIVALHAVDQTQQQDDQTANDPRLKDVQDWIRRDSHTRVWKGLVQCFGRP